MKKNILVSVFSLGLMVVPAIAFGYVEGLKQLLSRDVMSILSSIWIIIVSLAFLYFFWGLAEFIQKAGDSEERKDGQQKMLWGIIALTVMLSIMGLINTFAGLVGVPVDGSSTQSGNSLPGAISYPF